MLHGSCSQLNQGCRDTKKSFEPLKSVLLEKIFLKISPNLMKTPVPESLFNKVIDFLPVTLSQKETRTKVLSLQNVLEHLFCKTSPGDCLFLP